MSGAAHSGRKRRRGLVHKEPAKLDTVRNEINVTPLVDVCLVLLIIFMVITELLARGKEVPLPRTTQHEKAADQNQPIVVMDEKGDLYFDKEKVESLKAMKARVKEEWRSGESKVRRVYVKADAGLTYKEVYPLIMAVHELGLEHIDLGTQEKKDE